MALSDKQFYFDATAADGSPKRILVRIKNVPNSRTIRLRATGRDEAVITKPRYISKKRAMEFLEENARWLAGKAEEFEQKISLPQYIRDGGKIWAAGREYKIETITSRSSAFSVDNPEAGVLAIAATERNREGDIQAEFLKFASKKLTELAREEAERTGLRFARISLRDQSSRWASQSSSGTLSLNWRIMLLNPQQQRYIICHELAHTKFMDHSVSFWILTNRLCPGSQKLDREISKLGAKIFNVHLI